MFSFILSLCAKGHVLFAHSLKMCMGCWLFATRPSLCCHDLSSHSSDKFISQICLQMWKAMEDLRKSYCVAYAKVDSAHLGDPACRRRVYIIMVRRHLAKKSSKGLATVSQPMILDLCDPARDVILQKLKNHSALESHCLETYKKLTMENPVAISVPLRKSQQYKLNVIRFLCCLSRCCLFSVACPLHFFGSENSEARAHVAEGLPIPEDSNWGAGERHGFQEF